MKVYLIRHGESVANVQRIMSGKLDVALTEKGFEQARQAAEKLRDVEFAAIYSSDLQRAADTAAEIARGRSVSHSRTEKLRERDFGSWEGIKFDDIEKLYPQQWKEFLEKGYNYDIPGGESVEYLYGRVVGEYENILSNYDTDSDVSVCIVAHGCVLMALFSYLVYGNKDGYSRFRFDNAKINMVEIMDGYTVVRTLNA